MTLPKEVHEILALLEQVGVTMVCVEQRGNYQIGNMTPAALATALSERLKAQEK